MGEESVNQKFIHIVCLEFKISSIAVYDNVFYDIHPSIIYTAYVWMHDGDARVNAGYISARILLM